MQNWLVLNRTNYFPLLLVQVLLRIFRKLEFSHLIWVSVVSSRWNRLIFQLLERRVWFRLTGNDGMASLSGHRTYKQVSLRERKLRVPKFSPGLLQALGCGAESLEIDCHVVHPELLLYVLQFFRSVVKLKLVVEVFHWSQIDAATFLEQARGILPEVRFLTMNAQFYKSVGLLAMMAPTLVTLDVRVREQLLAKFYECRFDNLEELTFRMSAMPLPFQPSCFRAAELVDFLARQNNLRKLGLHVWADFVTWDFSKLTGIEELTLDHDIFNISGLSQMTRLRSLSCKHIFVNCSNAEPVPSLAKLELNSSSSIDAAQLARIFPNLMTLILAKLHLATPEMEQIVRAWPSLEELSFAMSGFEATLLVPLQQFRKLRKLSVEATVENEVRARKSFSNQLPSNSPLITERFGRILRSPGAGIVP